MDVKCKFCGESDNFAQNKVCKKNSESHCIKELFFYSKATKIKQIGKPYLICTGFLDNDCFNGENYLIIEKFDGEHNVHEFKDEELFLLYNASTKINKLVRDSIEDVIEMYINEVKNKATCFLLQLLGATYSESIIFEEVSENQFYRDILNNQNYDFIDDIINKTKSKNLKQAIRNNMNIKDIGRMKQN